MKLLDVFVCPGCGSTMLRTPTGYRQWHRCHCAEVRRSLQVVRERIRLWLEQHPEER